MPSTTSHRQRASRLPAQTREAGQRIVEDAQRRFHPELSQLDEYGAAFTRHEPVITQYDWTTGHPEFALARESARSAWARLLATTKMGRELALAAQGRSPGGWTEEQTYLFWLCEARYPYRQRRAEIQQTVPLERLSAFRDELKRRRNNASKRKNKPAPRGRNPVTREIEMIDPLCADLSPVQALITRLWVRTPLWLADSWSIAKFLEEILGKIGAQGKGWFFRKTLLENVSTEWVDHTIFVLQLHRSRSLGRVRYVNANFVPDLILRRRIDEHQVQVQANRQKKIPTTRELREAVDGEISFIREHL